MGVKAGTYLLFLEGCHIEYVTVLTLVATKLPADRSGNQDGGSLKLVYFYESMTWQQQQSRRIQFAYVFFELRDRTCHSSSRSNVLFVHNVVSAYVV
jgi:hypothetical protein